MSRRRVYSDNTLAIMERFFTAFDIAVQNRLIKSIAEYCRDNSIAPPHFYTQRKDRNRGYFEVGWNYDAGYYQPFLFTADGSGSSGG